MDEDADQILTIEELRSLRDQMGVEAAARAVPVSAAAEADPPMTTPVQARPDPWEDLRRRARSQRRWAGARWAGPLAATGCLALAGGVVTALVITAHHRSVSPSAPTSPAPATSAVPVTTSAPIPPAPEPAAPELLVPESSPVAPAPIVLAPTPSADAATAAVPAPRVTNRPKRPAATVPSSAPSLPPSVSTVEQPSGAAGDRAGAAGAEPTLTRTSTSWSPSAPP